MAKRSANTPRTTARNRDIAASVIAWFGEHARDLPWRHDRNGYTGLVSEAMLQQTQVSRVVDSYDAFMRRFPTVQVLAAADEQDVLASWNGLGYYRRARHLHAAAKAVVDQHDGDVPREIDQLKSLPGVGRYTAGAIASIIYGCHAPLVDGNVHRVLARLECDDRPIDTAEARGDTWMRAESLVSAAADPGVFNEGLMEIGATICTPKLPKCHSCPIRRHCKTHKRDLVDQIPAPKKRTTRKTVHHHAVVLTRNGRVLLEKRSATGLWGNMWQPPAVECNSKLNENAIRKAVSVPLRSLKHVEQFTHMTTHREVVFHVYRGTTSARRGEWISIESLATRSLSNAHRRVLTMANVFDGYTP